MLNRFIPKILDLSFVISSKVLCHFMSVVSVVLKTSGVKEKKKILALPYYPENWPGGHERIANWKPYFEEKGFVFDVSWASNDREFLKYCESDNLFKKYYFYFLVLLRRQKLLFKIKKYDTVWIQRAFVPFYPYKHAKFEFLLSKIHPNVVMDYYDADYISNYDLTIETVRYANKVTVSTNFLKEYYLKLNSVVHMLNMTIDESTYKLKNEYATDDVKLGWMGSKGNMTYLKNIEKELKMIEESFPNVSFHFLCRGGLSLDLDRVTMYSWENSGFDYFDWLNEMDLGLAPYFGDSDSLKAKSSMKSLEFMACGIPLITSEHGVFNKMKNMEHFLLANEPKDWVIQLKTIIEDVQLRRKIGMAGYDFFKNHHTYESNLDELIHILTK